MTEPADTPPPRAFTQGVGTVFQFTGVITFLAFFFTCCFSGLLSKETATQTHLGSVGWGIYSAQRALSICMVIGILLGLALAAIGLGLQAQRRRSAMMAVVATSFGVIFWLVHAILFATAAGSILLALMAGILSLLFMFLFALSLGAWKEMRKTPPPAGFELLPVDYKIPYSHMHQDPPEVRLARELEQRRGKLAIQQKELEMLEQKLHDKLKPKDQ